MKLNKLNTDKVLYWVSWLLFALVILLNLQTGSIISQILNPESCYIPFLYKDIVEYGGSFKEWNFQPAPSIFPEMIFYFLFQTIFNDFRITILLYILFHIIFVIYWWGKLSELFLEESSIWIKTNIILFVSISLLPFSCTNILADIRKVYLLGVSNHSSLTWVMPLVLYFVFKGIFSKNISPLSNLKDCILIGIISFLMSLSDLLYIVQIALPIVLLLSVIFKRNPDKRKETLYRIMFVSSTSIFGYAIFKCCIPTDLLDGYISFNPFYLFEHYSDVINSFLLHFVPFYMQIYIIAAVLLQIIFVLFRMCKNDNSAHYNFTLFNLISSFFVILGSIVFRTAGMRYYIILVIVPIIWLISSPLLNRTQIMKWLLFIGAIIAISFQMYKSPLQFSNVIENALKTPYPEWLKKLDDYCKERNLKEGLADYSNARYIEIFSREKIRIGQIWGISPFVRLYNIYTCRKITPSFILIDKGYKSRELNLVVLTNFFGAPDDIYELGEDRLILNYANNSFIKSYYKDTNYGMDDIRDGIYFKGYTLPGDKDTVKGKSRVLSSGSSRCLTFGPYIELPKGEYQFNFIYEAISSDTNDIAGKYDVYYLWHNGEKYIPYGLLQEGVLPSGQSIFVDILKSRIRCVNTGHQL